MVENAEEIPTRARTYTFSQYTNYDDYDSCGTQLQYVDHNESRLFLQAFSSSKAKSTLEQILKPKLDNLRCIQIIYLADDLELDLLSNSEMFFRGKNKSFESGDLQSSTMNKKFAGNGGGGSKKSMVDEDQEFMLEFCKKRNEIFERIVEGLGLFLNKRVLEIWKYYCPELREPEDQMFLFDNNISGQLGFMLTNYDLDSYYSYDVDRNAGFSETNFGDKD